MNNTNVREYKCEHLKEKYYVYDHPSGLAIYLFPKEQMSAYAFFGTRYGSTDNCFKTREDGEFITVPDGIAHFLEHKLFANEDGSDSFERFSEYGADANAYTSFNRTTYYFGCTENFDKSLRELLTFVTHPYFTEESVAKERGIIGQEISMYDDNPSDRCLYGMLDGLYAHHSVKRNICGSAESIAKITPELLYDCYNTFYDLSNMVLAVSGNVSLEEIVAIADEILPQSKTERITIRSDENALEPAQVNKPLVEQKMNVSKPICCIGIKDTDLPRSERELTRRDIIMMVINELLFADSNALYNDLLDRELIQPGMQFGYTLTESFAYDSISFESDKPQEVFDIICSYVEKLKSDGLDREDFVRAKRVMYAEFVKLFDSTENIANMIFTYACDGTDVFSNHEILSALTFEEVEEHFKKAFKKEYMTLSVVYSLV